jgi:hypothetical protein
MNLHKSDCENFHRRDFLHVGALSLMGLSLPQLLATDAQANELDAWQTTQHRKPARNIIMIWLAGGPSTIDMWDLKPDAPAKVRGEFRPIKTSADHIQICEHLPKIAKQMNQCSLVRSLTHTVAEHGQGTEYVMTGNPISPAVKYPSIGSVVAKKLPGAQGVPAYIDMSGFDYGKAGYLGSSYNPFVVDGFQTRRRNAVRASSTRNQFELPNGFTVEDLNRKNELLKKLEQGFRRFDETPRAAEMTKFQQQAIDILSSGKTRKALDISQEEKKIRDRYGSRALGRSALAARRLIQAGVRFVSIGISGWDTHSNNFGSLRNTLLPQLDTALSALIDDLQSCGILDETIVYCVGEFNRTPNINTQGGRDHWARSMSALIAGGGFKKGFAYGSTDQNGFEPDSNACSPADVSATILNQCGIRPDSTLVTNSGRPVQVFRDAEIIKGLVSN